MPDLAVSDDDTHLYGQTFGGDRQSKLTKRETLCAQDAAIKAAWLNFFARCAPGLYRLDILADDDDGHDYQGKDPLGRSRGKYALEHLQLESLPVLGALSSLHIGIYKGLRLEPFFKHGHLFPSLEILAFHHTERAPNKPWVVTREQGNKFMHPRTVQILGLPKGLTFGTRTSSGRTLHPSPRASPVSSSKAGPSQRAPTFTPIWMPCFPKSRLPAPQLALDQDASLWREPQTLHGALSVPSRSSSRRLPWQNGTLPDVALRPRVPRHRLRRVGHPGTSRDDKLFLPPSFLRSADDHLQLRANPARVGARARGEGLHHLRGFRICACRRGRLSARRPRMTPTSLRTTTQSPALLTTPWRPTCRTRSRGGGLVESVRI
ncbi:hypothetical protein AAT19DRAFT_12607 [Rhodotorula toruloides]|uniref:Uncharacterized protein n=1 Tax=Rhodotorula toruloides TaxID=5286 RepID=A0A2T0AGQ1_RHOTO|nr:hypothetical protein AAT19DRAFT_12607 [Rhodotorula toruloides]